MDDKNTSPEEIEEEEEYHFLKETVKQPPVSPRRILGRVLFVLVCGALFGAAAAGTFVGLTASAKERQSTRVTFSQDENGEEAAASGGTDSGTTSEAAASAPQDSTAANENGAAGTPAGSGDPIPSSAANAPAGSAGTQAVAGAGEDSSALALTNFENLNGAMKRIADRADASIVEVTGITSTEDWFKRTDTSTATQSGLIVADNGTSLLVLASSDAIGGATRIVVTMPDESIVEASLVKKDNNTGLCVVSIPLSSIAGATKDSYTVADLGNSYTVSAGDSVIAIGSPLGYSDSVAYGEVTSTHNTVSVVDGEYNLLTTDIQGSPEGNGFLINLDGQVVGCIFQKYATQNSSVVTGVPISLLKYLIEELSNKTAISYAGIHGQSVTQEISRSSGIPVGVYITSVEPDSPALAAGLMAGDVLVQMDGLKVSSMTLVHNKLTALKPGETVPVRVERAGNGGYVEFNFLLTVGEAN